jgi:hypothetical protein
MIRKSPALALVLGGLMMAAQARAQETPALRPPFVVLPERAAWTVTVRSLADTGSGEMGQPLRVESVVGGALKRDLLFQPGQGRREIWYREGMMLLPSEDGGRAFVMDPRTEDTGISANALCSAGYPCVAWIEARHFRSFTERDNVKCLFFETPQDPLMRAWIEESTRRPLAVEMGGTLFQFTHREAPAEPLVLPSVYESAWNRYRALAERRKAIQGAK